MRKETPRVMCIDPNNQLYNCLQIVQEVIEAQSEQQDTFVVSSQLQSVDEIQYTNFWVQVFTNVLDAQVQVAIAPEVTLLWQELTNVW